MIDWFARRAPVAAIRWSRWLLAGAAACAILETAVLFARIVDGNTIRVPRFEAFAVSSVTAVAVLGLWALGTAALMSDRWRVRAGWLAGVGAVSAGLLDRQTLAGEVIYLVAVFSFLHWMHAVLDSQGSGVGHAPLRVIQWQISVVFAWTAIAKLNPIFLSGGILWVAFDGPVPWPDILRGQPVLMAIAVGTILFEIAVAVGFWLKGVRRGAVVGAVLFHVFIVLFLSPTMALVAFALVMGCGYVLFAAEPWAAPEENFGTP